MKHIQIYKLKQLQFSNSISTKINDKIIIYDLI